jgi:hypothetical protein
MNTTLVMGKDSVSPSDTQSSFLQFAKEFRALLPIALAGTALLLFLRICPRFPASQFFSPILYTVFCSALGALSVGHDLVYGTTSFCLTLPISRSRLWTRKLIVAAASMIPLTVVYALCQPKVIAELAFTTDSSFPNFSITNAMLYGICVAPWLTLLSRSTLCGTFVAAGLPTLLQISLPEDFENVRSILFQSWRIGIALSPLIALALSRKEFQNSGEPKNLQEISFGSLWDSAAREVLPAPKFWQLCKKELMLQRLSVVLGLFSLGLNFFLDRKSVGLWNILYPSFIALLIGATASAEERQFGTWQWQLLLPSARSIQWVVKVVTVLLLCVLFSAVLPLEILRRFGRAQDIPPGALGFMMVNALCLGLTGLYISSLCSNSLKAMLLAIAPGVIVIATEIKVASWIIFAASELPFDDIKGRLARLVVLTVVAWFLLLRFAKENHFSEIRGRGRLLQQLVYLGMILAIAQL